MTKKKSKIIISIGIIATLIGCLTIFFLYRENIKSAKMELVLLAREQVEVGDFDAAKRMLVEIDDEKLLKSLKDEISILEKIQGTWNCVGQYDKITDTITGNPIKFSFKISGSNGFLWTDVQGEFEKEFYLIHDGITVQRDESYDDYFFIGAKKRDSSEWNYINYIVDDVTGFAYKKE